MAAGSYFIDSNIYLRVIVKDDKRKAEDCEQLIHKVIKKELKAATSILVVAEVAWTLLSFYKLSKGQVAELLRGIAAIKNLKIKNNENLQIALDIFTAYNVKFIDCLLASQPDIRSGKTAIVSYDRDFDKLGVTRLEPADLIN